ncbi:MAG: pyruvate, phosphate dikinase [Bacteroidetes bacterium]|nr:pyruvate, phosphate dikinase [Bacteroidota bacterium]MBU1678764.1 pyruvate, phosphate dikinase [Bacteroidota bacterium]MBU2507220.1 pyruvate, phosphate dikinase [Bacteroidota bacterium]
MYSENKPIDMLVSELQERAKELNCLYRIEEALSSADKNFDDAFIEIINSIPPGWQYPDICEAKITFRGKIYKTKKFVNTPWFISASITIRENEVGQITVAYLEEIPNAEENPFLPEEEKLLRTIADRLSHFILHHDLKIVFKDLKTVREDGGENRARGEWRIVLDMIRKTDPNLFMSILRKLLHQLCWKGIEEADILLKHSSIAIHQSEEEIIIDENKPLKKKIINNYDEYIDAILKLSDKYLKDDDILLKVQKWIQDDKSSALVKAVEARETSLSGIADAIRKYYHLAPEKFELSASMIKGLRVSLLRRLFTENLDFIRIAKDYVKLTDFYKLIDKMIYMPNSHGKLGGKSSGIFLASNILEKNITELDLFKNIKIPKTWYMASDCVLAFMQYNNLDEVLEQKYKEIDELRLEYPHIVQLFKNSQFPPDIQKGLSVALDDFSDRPLVVRSSSLLEDQMGASFSGKYKSLFLANQGSKQERLAALEDAIAEVYASTFSPDPIEYRAERGLLDFHEEMGVMIQEVVGNKIGKYYMPTYAGVAFSNNEFKWSPRIKSKDGLVRIVPGLGTRAVDRIADDYPILIAPGQPNLRVNASLGEALKYAPKKMDVINLETNEFETISVDDMIREYGDQCPGLNHVVSIYEGGMLRQPMGINLDYETSDFVVTFEGLISNTRFIKRIREILNVLQESLKSPVDIEFASDGRDFYLLQCRPQSFSVQHSGDPIPKDVPKERIIFSANKYISNGKVPELSHIVYVDPIKYGELPDKQSLRQVGRAVSKLNKVLPKRKFVLMGPGRWGSRGDMKLGVNVTYSDINNTALLIEIAKKKGNYIPDLSFGTHFFQDLVEANIRYLPLYPDNEGIIFNERFFKVTKNILADLAPEFEALSDVIKVIDVEEASKGMILKVLVNADLDEALAILKSTGGDNNMNETPHEYAEAPIDDQWKWRFNMAEKIVHKMDAEKYGVKAVYIFGSTKNAIAGPASDIDLLIHISENEQMKKELDIWFSGWSCCLSEMNYLRTGYRTDGLLDIHYITDEDIANKTSYAIKIGAVTDAAKPLFKLTTS